MGGCGFDTPDWVYTLCLFDENADVAANVLTRTHYHFARGALHVHSNSDPIDVPEKRRFSGARDRFPIEASQEEGWSAENLHWLRSSHAPMREYAAELARGLSAAVDAAANRVALLVVSADEHEEWGKST